MMDEIIDRIRKNRELSLPVALPCGKTVRFTCRRPTDAEAHRLAMLRAEDSDIARDYVTGWSGVIEDDIVGGGGSDAVDFNPRRWGEWCADLGPVMDDGGETVVYAGVWKPISEGVLNAWKERGDALRAAAKK